ncbi:GPP34 family phosphoprotein [Streptomyces sp. NPDC002896]|uniref:GOLPH3/VPS74 family protein n=1 Tax=Streptomyces sp. NPDC002896 TaxID=3154438 RepID=UPI00331D0BA9
MPTLTEELALLLLNDSGRSTVDLGRCRRAVGSAILLDLVRADRIAIESPADALPGVLPVVRDGAATGDPVLDKALETLGGRQIRLERVTETIGRDCWPPLLESLVGRGLLRQEEGRLLGLVRTHAWPLVDHAYKREAVGRVRGAVIERRQQDEPTLLLVMLLHSAGALAAVLPGEDRETVEARAGRLVRSTVTDSPWHEVFRGLDTALFTVLLAS